MGRGPLLTNDEKAKIDALKQAGHGLRETARLMNRSTKAVSNYLRYNDPDRVAQRQAKLIQKFKNSLIKTSSKSTSLSSIDGHDIDLNSLNTNSFNTADTSATTSLYPDFQAYNHDINSQNPNNFFLNRQQYLFNQTLSLQTLQAATLAASNNNLAHHGLNQHHLPATTLEQLAAFQSNLNDNSFVNHDNHSLPLNLSAAAAGQNYNELRNFSYAPIFSDSLQHSPPLVIAAAYNLQGGLAQRNSIGSHNLPLNSSAAAAAVAAAATNSNNQSGLSGINGLSTSTLKPTNVSNPKKSIPKSASVVKSSSHNYFGN